MYNEYSKIKLSDLTPQTVEEKTTYIEVVNPKKDNLGRCHFFLYWKSTDQWTQDHPVEIVLRCQVFFANLDEYIQKHKDRGNKIVFTYE